MYHISIDECGDAGTENVGGLEERLVGGPVCCSLDANVWYKFGRKLNYLPCLPANEPAVPRVRNGIGRYFITRQCDIAGFTWPIHVVYRHGWERETSPFSLFLGLLLSILIIGEWREF